MSETNGKTSRDKSVDRRSTISGDTHRTKRSHRSRSRERDHDKDRDRDRDYRRRDRDRSRDRHHRDRDRERDRDRDRDRERERDRDRERGRERDKERDRDYERRRRSDMSGDGSRGQHHHLDRERDERDRRDRRRPREDDDVDEDRHRERTRRKRDDDDHRRRDMSPRAPRSRDGEVEPSLHPPLDVRPRRMDVDDREGQRDRRPDSPDLDDPMDQPSRRRSPPRRPSPSYEAPSALINDEPERPEDDSEARSVFVSQLAARLTARDLGYFFEDKLGEGSVRDCRIVTDRISRRSKGIAYVEFRSIELVPKAIALSGTVVMGLPIMIQLTEAERNRTHAADLANAGGHTSTRGAMQLYVGSLHFNLTESDIRQVFEPFGELDFVDLHRDPLTGRSKGYAFVQYKRPEDAKMALEQMEGFELAGRALRVNTVHEKGSASKVQQDSLEENGGANLNAASRQALMQKLARTDSAPAETFQQVRPSSIPSSMTTKCVLLKNMFSPDEETEPDWDKELADEVTKECENKYGKVLAIKVEPESAGEIYIRFDSIENAAKAVASLHGRYFSGKPISATHISDAIMQAHV